MAICAIPEFGDAATLVMLDEIEDGIEPHILPELVGSVVTESPSQFVFTSHSPLLVNHFQPEDIHILARRPSGSVAACSFAALDHWNSGQEYFGPGELWSMTERRVHQSEVFKLSPTIQQQRRSRDRFLLRSVRRFLSSRNASS